MRVIAFQTPGHPEIRLNGERLESRDYPQSALERKNLVDTLGDGEVLLVLDAQEPVVIEDASGQDTRAVASQKCFE
ncbi:MAG: hypothetical protein HY815_30985 [Candidatus Riflebacteria bacterium]|nr:hypothetical protein [Candidatus Riflebacteria bacterium]